jgi:ArsR family metal-binding transcriptional regulator
MMLIKAFSDLSTSTPACHPGVLTLGASFKLDSDISQLFPYINSVVKDARYFDKPHYIKFTFDEKRWALYPDHGAATPFETQAQAAEYINRLIDFLNGLWDKKDTVSPDHEKYKPLPVLDIFRILPRTNCGECGYPACMAFAAALGRSEASYEECPDLNAPEMEETLINLGLW